MAKEARGDFYPVPIVDQSTRPGTITRLIVFIVVLTGAAIVFGIFRDRLGDPFLLGMLGVLAMIGVGYLFATAIGFVQIAPRSRTDELSKSFVDSMSQGLVVTDTKARVVYANRAYADMTGASGPSDLKTIEALLSEVPEASATIDRLASGLRDGQHGFGEFRMPQSVKPGAEPGARWYRAQARAFKVPGQRQSLHAYSPSRTFHASAPSRSASSSTCNRRSTISITHRRASSRPTPRAASPISTPRWPNGSASTWPVFLPAPPRWRRSWPATAWRWCARSRPIPAPRATP